jgi:hypothetical protein
MQKITLKNQSTAKAIAAMFNNDCTAWCLRDTGVTIIDIAIKQGGVKVCQGYIRFADGSAITYAANKLWMIEE